ncbi:MAG TPA: hypothetical protein VGM20_09835 [Gemmatimonadales bacterium]|jgi:hypothetical protein
MKLAAALLLVSVVPAAGQTIKYSTVTCSDPALGPLQTQQREFKGKYDEMSDSVRVVANSETTSSMVANTHRTLTLGIRFQGKDLAKSPQWFLENRWEVQSGDLNVTTKDLTAQSRLQESEALAILIDDSVRSSLPALAQGRQQNTSLFKGHTMTEVSTYEVPSDLLVKMFAGKEVKLRVGQHLFKWHPQDFQDAAGIYQTVVCRAKG